MALNLRSPRNSMLGALAALLTALPRSRDFSKVERAAPGPFPLAPPRVYSRRELRAGASRYMPHQGKREQLRRRMGGFAGVPRSVQSGRETPDSWYARVFGIEVEV